MNRGIPVENRRTTAHSLENAFAQVLDKGLQKGLESQIRNVGNKVQ